MTRITTTTAMLPGACVLLTLARPDQPRPTWRPRRPRRRSPVVRDGKLAGRLLVTPSTAKPGDQLQLTVKNVGTIAMTYGLAQRVQQHVDSRWRNGAKATYGTSEPGFRLIAYSVEPGNRRHPRG